MIKELSNKIIYEDFKSKVILTDDEEKALEDFIKVLHEEAETPQQKQMLSEALQKSMR